MSRFPSLDGGKAPDTPNTSRNTARHERRARCCTRSEHQGGSIAATREDAPEPEAQKFTFFTVAAKVRDTADAALHASLDRRFPGLVTETDVIVVCSNSEPDRHTFNTCSTVKDDVPTD